MKIIREISQHFTVTEIHAMTGMFKSMVWRMLHTSSNVSLVSAISMLKMLPIKSFQEMLELLGLKLKDFPNLCELAGQNRRLKLINIGNEIALSQMQRQLKQKENKT